MKRTTKIVVTLVLALVMLVPATIGTFAAMPPSIEPQWDSIATMSLDMGFEPSPTALGIARKKSTATRIEGTVTVYEWVDDDWSFVAEGSGEKTIGSLAINVDFTAESGVTYKAEFEVTAYTGSTPEVETIESIKTCP